MSRITPAWAGTTEGELNQAAEVADYPRVGGDDSSAGFSSAYSAGLPPRGRGRHALHHPSPDYPRITPAWAGTTTVPVMLAGKLTDYPRVGGDDRKR